MKHQSTYQSYNAQLFPLRKFKLKDADSKKPFESGWPFAKYSGAEINQYIEDGHSIAWALGPNDLVIDVDVATDSRPGKQGAESLEKLKGLLEGALEKAPVVESLSGGKHYYLQLASDVPPLRKSHPDFPGIDFLRYGSYVVAAGSPHWQSGEYELRRGENERPVAPATLIDKLSYDMPEFETGEHQEITADQLKELLECLDPSDFREHDQWFKVFAASHSATGGGPEGLVEFTAWSTSDPAYAHASSAIKARWNTLKKNGGISLRTLQHFVNDRGDPEKVSELRHREALEDFQVLLPKVVEVIKTRREKTVNSQCIAALANDSQVFKRDGKLIEVVRQGQVAAVAEYDGQTPTIHGLSVDSIRERVAEVVDLNSIKPGGDKKPERVTKEMAGAIAARRIYPEIRPLDSVLESPVLLPDGSILQTPGYHESARLLYAPVIDYPTVTNCPLLEDAKKAMGVLKAPFAEFDFESDPHRSMFLALILTTVARLAINGPTPIFFIRGNNPGVGKSLLAHCASIISSGRAAPVTAYPPKDDEMAKQLTSIAKAGFRMQLWDNVPNGSKFGSPSLDGASTSTIYRGRTLSKNDMPSYEFRTVLAATGNTLEFAKECDTKRRTALISLDCKEEDPEKRTFNIANLQQHCMDNRANLTIAALTILRAYRYAKSPRQTCAQWGSFEKWQELVPQAIVWCGEADPCLVRNSLEEADSTKEDTEAMVRIVEQILQLEGKGCLPANEIVSALRKIDISDKLARQHEEDREEVVNRLKHVGVLFDAHGNPGNVLAKYRDKPTGGRRLRRFKHKGVRVWGIESNEAGPLGA